jgi:YegS/Rv2252/BmrU family lipid kinase
LKILLVYNPRAGHGRSKTILPEVEDAFNHKGITFDLAMTDYPEHATEIVRAVKLTDYDGLVAAGGDGTLFEVINGYFQNPKHKKVPLGILPTGTGNAFVRDMTLPDEGWKGALEVIARNQPRPVDVGRFTTHGQTYYYLNILGLGFVADVGDIARKLKIFGNVAYTLGVFQKTVRLRSYHLVLEADGRTYERENVFVEISNTRYTSNFLMAPNASVDDGLLDVTLLNKLSRRRLLAAFPTIFSGEHIHLPEVEHFQARKIHIETEPAKILTPDGELVGITPTTVECLPKAVPVFW